MKNIKRDHQGIMGLVVFAVMVIVCVNIYVSIDNNIKSALTTNMSIAGSAKDAYNAYGNTSSNTLSAFNLIAVGPIIFGAVIVLGIVGMLYMRR